MDWTTAEDVAEMLEVVDATDQQLIDAVAASDAWCKRRRPDLDPDTEAPGDVAMAAKLYAAYLYRLDSSPQGLPGDDGFGDFQQGDAMSNIFRLLGSRKPVAR